MVVVKEEAADVSQFHYVELLPKTFGEDFLEDETEELVIFP